MRRVIAATSLVVCAVALTPTAARADPQPGTYIGKWSTTKPRSRAPLGGFARVDVVQAGARLSLSWVFTSKVRCGSRVVSRTYRFTGVAVDAEGSFDTGRIRVGSRTHKVGGRVGSKSISARWVLTTGSGRNACSADGSLFVTRRG